MRSNQLAPSLLALVVAALTPACASSQPAADVAAGPAHLAARDRTWIGPGVWANRLQDWRVRAGRIECPGARPEGLPRRTLHFTTVELVEGDGTWRQRLALGALDPSNLAPDAVAGVWIGAGAGSLDWRARALVQSETGTDGGVLLGLRGDGHLTIQDMTGGTEEPLVSVARLAPGRLVDAVLELSAERDGPTTRVSVRAMGEQAVLAELTLERTDRSGERALDLVGNVALVCHRSPFWFVPDDVEGTLVARDPTRTIGPIVGALHTLSRGTLKLTAQLLPLAEPGELRVEVERGGRFEEVAVVPVDPDGWTAHVRVEDWGARKDRRYRLSLSGWGPGHAYTGTIRAEPTDDELVLAALSCNHNNRFGFGRPGYDWNEDALWFPHTDLVARLQQQDPDLLFFAGDQIYEGASPTPPDRKGDPQLDYLYKWSLWHLAFGELTKDRPCVTIPDDHDVYQGNLWGAGGRAAKRDNEGGYVMPAEWVRMVERTQTSHLPDPFDATPIEQGIGVYYTDLVYGGVSFAILEDRKFKSGCADLELGGPRPDHITDPDVDTRVADRADKVLLGERQLAFLDAWARDWDGVALKAALSQTPFANLATHHGARQDYLRADLDSNGWPQSGRDRALVALRKAFAFHVAGDQHLATLVHHGVDDWEDATWSFTMPAIANFYARSWRPEGEPQQASSSDVPFTGRYVDGFGNKVTMHAVANPGEPTGLTPAALHDQVPGYGIVRFDKAAQEIVVECWPRAADPATGAQYPGWPRTVAQASCYGREAPLALPEVAQPGATSFVVEVTTEDGALVHARRVAGDRCTPRVFTPGRYRVRWGDGDAWQERVVPAR